ncbi:unnamed protein product, partial [Mesorhabditis belari]|uniref:Uncharacterized protein n=1 Tax=Mesorhabditis belari TaxID=2138241 RepID=A0AAF3EAZ3_9BILA
MSSDYSNVKVGALKLKGKKNIFKAERKKKSKGDANAQIDEDAIAHGGWWMIKDEVDLKGGIHISLESGNGNRCYLAAMDNGRFTIGAPHTEGEGPNPEEVFALVRTPDEQKFSMKTGYGKYIGIDTSGQLVATAEAIGTRERFVAVFQDGKSAIQSVSNPLFLSMKPDKEGYVFVASRTASEDEMINIRTDVERTGPVDWRPAEDKQSARECETSYVKMFQHSKVDLKGRHVSVDINNKQAVKRAQKDGDLHELLLERRKKTKSDRYC